MRIEDALPWLSSLDASPSVSRGPDGYPAHPWEPLQGLIAEFFENEAVVLGQDDRALQARVEALIDKPAPATQRAAAWSAAMATSLAGTPARAAWDALIEHASAAKRSSPTKTWLRKADHPDHPGVASSRSNLASVLHAQGKYGEAEAENRAALSLKEKTLGANHPDVATSRNNLAGKLFTQGKHAEAETENRAALSLLEKALGPDHPRSRRFCGGSMRARPATAVARAS